MAKKTKAAAAAITITADCERDADGFGVLPFAQHYATGKRITRAAVSALKAHLLKEGFESDEAEINDGMPVAIGWDPRADGLVAPGWAMVAMLHLDEGDGIIALFARPANESAPWPFQKGKDGESGPAVSSDASIEDGEHDVAPAAPSMTKSEAHLQRKVAQFELLEPTDALLKTFTPRVEKHGDDDVSAASLGLQIEAPNTILDQLSPSLRATLYAAPEGQVTLPGIVETMPLLRTKVIENLKLTNCYEGWTLVITAGANGDITIKECKVDKFVVTPRDGGSVLLDLRVGSSDISEDEAGWLYGHLRHEIEITLHSPEQQPEAIDGSVAAFEADHPDAGDLFAAEHGHQSSGDDQARDEGADVDEQPAEEDAEA